MNPSAPHHFIPVSEGQIGLFLGGGRGGLVFLLLLQGFSANYMEAFIIVKNATQVCVVCFLCTQYSENINRENIVIITKFCTYNTLFLCCSLDT